MGGPGTHDPTDNVPSNRYAFAWSNFDSPNRQVTAQGHHDTIGWAPGDMYVDKTLWICHQLCGVAGGRYPGRVLDFHSHPARGGWEPEPGGFVSAIAIDWLGDQSWGAAGGPGLMLTLQAQDDHHGVQKKWQLASVAEMDAHEWLDFVWEIEIGLPGRVRIWKNGSDVPVVDTGPADTQWRNQTGFLMFTGVYNSSGVNEWTSMDHVAPRYGRTLAEALADTPVLHDTWGCEWDSDNSKAWKVDTIVGPPSFRVPPSLGGTTPDGIQVTVVSEDATTRTLGWAKVEGSVGFKFTVDGKVSHTWDGNRTSVRVAKTAKNVTVQSLSNGPKGGWSG